MDIKHSGFKSLTVFLKACAKEGLIKIKETKGGMVVTGTNQFCVVGQWFNGGFQIGVDATHPVVRAHARHVTIKEVEAHKGKREEAQTQEFEKHKEERREQQVTLLRKLDPVTAPFFQRLGKERVSPADKLTLEIADIEPTPARRSS